MSSRERLPVQYGGELDSYEQPYDGGHGLEAYQDDNYRPPAESHGVPQQVLMAWQNDAAGFDYRQRNAAEMEERALNELGDYDAADIVASFNQLPVGARSAIFLEMGLGSPARRLPNAEATQLLLEAPGGRMAMSTWRGRAEQNAATVVHRIASVAARMSPSDAQAALEWLDALPAHQQCALFRAMC